MDLPGPQGPLDMLLHVNLNMILEDHHSVFEAFWEEYNEKEKVSFI